jgi:uncharacterized alpha-E superfamily protein
VTELLLLRNDVPQSLHRCVAEVHSNLRAVANQQSAETERRAGELHARFQFGRLEDLVQHGLKPFLGDFLGRVDDLGQRISQDFLVPVSAC